MEWLGKAKDFVIDKANAVGIPIPKIEKTVDPDYVQAKETYKALKVDTERIIGSVVQMNTQLQILSKSTKKFGEDMSNIFVNTSQNTKNEAKSIALFGDQFEKFTNNILEKQIDSNFIAPLAVFQKEIKRLKTVREKRRPALKEYDEARAKLQAYKDSNQPTNVIEIQSNETNEAFQKYNNLNQDFISNVNRLAMQRTQILDHPFRNLSNIMSQYLMQIFNEMSKMKVSFPQHVFQPRVPMAPVGAAPQVQSMPPPQMQQQFMPPPQMQQQFMSQPQMQQQFMSQPQMQPTGEENPYSELI